MQMVTNVLKEPTRKGPGIEYDANGNKRFEGIFNDDKRNGPGIEYDENGDGFEGTYKDGKCEIVRSVAGNDPNVAAE